MIIIDNFLDKDLLRAIQNHVTSENVNYTLHRSDQKIHTFLASYDTDSYMFSMILLKLKEQGVIKNIDFLRSYVNLNPAGTTHAGDWHIDGDDPRDVTVLLYPMPWKSEYGGGTSFKTGKTVEYKENRIVVFSGNLEHKADAHCAPGFRYSVAYKILADIKESS